MDSQNNQDDLDVSFITNNAINIDNMYEFISMLFENNEYDEDEQRKKYFMLSTFLLNNIQVPFNEMWRIFKIILAINPNITKEKTEKNKYFGIVVKLCVKFLHKSILNINLEKNSGFKCKEAPAIFDFFFSFPLIKHFINKVERKEQKDEINEILNEASKLMYEKIQAGKNNSLKNVFNSFSHFLDIDEKDISIPNSDKSKIIKIEINNNEINNKASNINNNTIDLNKSMINENKKHSTSNNTSFNQLKDKLTRPHSKNNSLKKEKKNNEMKNKIKINNNSDDTQKNKITNKKVYNTNNSIGKYISSEYRKNVNEEINTFRKFVKEVINKVYSFINFEEMKKAIKTKLPGNYLMQIGSFLYMVPFPDYSNINIDLLISRQNNSAYYIKKYFDTFEAFKNMSNIKSSFFCLNKDQYFFDCFDKNKSFFHLTRTDHDENEILKKYNFKTVTVHLYAYNFIYGYTSIFIKKVYSTLKNVFKLHLFFERILLQEFPILKSNYEISILILNFLQTNYKIFSEVREDKEFTYFGYDKSKNYGFLTNFPLLMQYKTLFFFEFDENNLNIIKQRNILDLVKEFHKFCSKYFEFILCDCNKYDKRPDLNIFKENNFLEPKYILNRIFLDNNLLEYKKSNFDEFRKIQNLFNLLKFE